MITGGSFWQGRAWSLKNWIQRRRYPRRLGIQVYGSARPYPGGPQERFYQLGVNVGRAIAQRGYFPVTGGGPGLMKAVMEGAAAEGGHSVGITVPIEQEVPATNLMQEVVHARTFAERLHGWSGFNHRAGRILVLPGGIGTDREFLSAIEEFAYGDHLSRYALQKHIVLLDFEQFFSHPGGLLDHLNYLIQAGMMSQSLIADFIRVAETVDQALDWLTHPEVPWTVKRRK